MAVPPSSKRGSGAVEPITGDELEQKFEQFRASQSIAMQAFQTNTQNHVSELVKSVSAVQTKRLENIEGEVSQLKSSQTKMELEHKTMAEQIAKLEKAMAIAEKDVVELAGIENDTFNRDPIFHKLKVGSIGELSRDTLLISVKEWLGELGIPEESWKLAGPPQGKQFSLFFSGPSGAGIRRARKANMGLRQEDGTWREIMVPTVDGPTSKLFIGPDKPPKQICEERMGKKLETILSETNPKFRLKLFKYAGDNKRETHIKVGGKTLLKCLAISREEQTPLWDNALVAELNIDKPNILAKFNTTAEISLAQFCL